MRERLFPRVRTSVPVSFSCSGAAESGTIENASIRGMRVLAAHAPALGEVLEMDVKLPNGRSIRVEARVVFVEPPAEGVRPVFAVELTHPNEEYASLLGLLFGANARKGTRRA